MEALTIEQMRDFYKRVYENMLNNINMLQDQMEKLINLWIVYSAHDQGMPQEINEVILEWLLMYKKGIQYLKRLTQPHIDRFKGGRIMNDSDRRLLTEAIGLKWSDYPEGNPTFGGLMLHNLEFNSESELQILLDRGPEQKW